MYGAEAPVTWPEPTWNWAEQIAPARSRRLAPRCARHAANGEVVAAPECRLRARFLIGGRDRRDRRLRHPRPPAGLRLLADALLQPHYPPARQRRLPSGGQ